MCFVYFVVLQLATDTGGWQGATTKLAAGTAGLNFSTSLLAAPPSDQPFDVIAFGAAVW